MKYVMIALLAAPFFATACVKSNPAKTTVYTPAGKATYHCPPGHRKKGWC